MEIRPGDAPVDDPFWAAVRRRHPDVDLVLLPPERTPGDQPGPPVDQEVVERALSEISSTATELWTASAPIVTDAPETRLRHGSLAGTVRAVARVVDHRSDGYGVLVSLRHELEQIGWEVVRPAGDVERLVGRRDGATVKASYAEQAGVVVFELSSADLAVGSERARSLVRGA